MANSRISDEELEKTRHEVLNQWKTGREVRFEEAVDYLRRIPPEKNFASRMRVARERKETLIQPRAGVALLDEHIALLQYLQDQGGADLLPTTIDSYTRQNMYAEAENGIRESRREGRSLLNGFPAVNYGVSACRKINESLKVPAEVRHGTPDARLLAEICFAGGFTSFEGGGISYNIPYSKNTPLEQSIRDWQYVDRLAGLYEEAGVPINREPFGPLTGTLVPPSMSHAVAIVESILAAEQGVKSLSVGYGQCGNLLQDVAAMHSLKILTEEYLRKFGFPDVSVTTVFHQWMGGFPSDEAKAFAVISWGAAAAVLSGATKVIVKSPHEALGIPTKEANAAGLKATRQLVTMLRGQRLPSTRELEEEMEMTMAETRCILERTIELGEGDMAAGAVRAFEAGVMDVPFAPSRVNRGIALPARDNDGAVRYLDFGRIPFTDDIRAFHIRKMEERARYEKRRAGFHMVIDDIYAVSKGMLVGRPNQEGNH